MAQSSGSFSGSINRGYQKLVVYWSSSQNVENNSSTIICDMYLESAGSIYIGARDNNTTTIDGNVIGYSTSAIQVSGSFSRLLGSVSQTIYHDTYGNKTFSMSSVFKIQATISGTYYDNITANSGNIELPNIPRASTIGVNDANIGSNTTITINKNSDYFSTQLFYRVQGDSNWTSIATTTQYSYAWTVPTSFYERIPDSKTIRVEFLGRTWQGSTLIGDKTTTATFTATGNPIINSVNIEDINQNTVNLTDDNSVLVIYQSTAKVSINASPRNSANISSVKVNNTNTTYNSTSGKWELEIENIATNEFEIKVTDTRGYSSSTTETTSKIDYIPLTINATLSRNEPTDGKINVSVNGNYFNDDFGEELNELVIQYRYIEYGGTYQDNWQNLTPTITNNTYSLTAQLSNFDYQKQYEFQVRAYDLLMQQQIIGISIPKGKPVYNWGEDFFNINGDIMYHENSIVEYSTNEVIIGKWKNNKPLYRKIITGTINATDYQRIYTINDLDTLIMLYGNSGTGRYKGTPNWFNLNASPIQFRVFELDNNSIICLQSIFEQHNYELVLVYTKTTDVV